MMGHFKWLDWIVRLQPILKLKMKELASSNISELAAGNLDFNRQMNLEMVNFHCYLIYLYRVLKGIYSPTIMV